MNAKRLFDKACIAAKNHKRAVETNNIRRIKYWNNIYQKYKKLSIACIDKAYGDRISRTMGMTEND
jgi:hypothetical protein